MFNIRKPNAAELERQKLIKHGVPAKDFKDCTHVMILPSHNFPCNLYKYDDRKGIITDIDDGVYFFISKNDLIRGIHRHTLEMWTIEE